MTQFTWKKPATDRYVFHFFLPELVGSTPVKTDSDPDADDWQDDAEEDKGSGFAHRFHTNVYNHSHDEKECRTVDPQIVVKHFRVLTGVPEKSYFRSDVILCSGIQASKRTEKNENSRKKEGFKY